MKAFKFVRYMLSDTKKMASFIITLVATGLFLIIRMFYFNAAPKLISPEHILGKFTYPLCFIDLSRDQKWLALGGWDGSLNVGELKDDKLIVRKTMTTMGMSCLSFSPDNKKLLVGASQIRMLNIKNWKLSFLFAVNDNHISSATYSFNGSLLALGGGGGIATYKSTDFKKIWSASDNVSLGAFSKDNGLLFTIATNETLLARDAKNGKIIWSVLSENENPRAMSNSGVKEVSMAVSPNDNFIAISGSKGSIKLISLKKREVFQTVTNSSNAISSLAFSPDGNQLVSGDWQGNIDVWDWKIKRNVAKLVKHSSPITSIVFLADKKLVTSSLDGLVCIWTI